MSVYVCVCVLYLCVYVYLTARLVYLWNSNVKLN